MRCVGTTNSSTSTTQDLSVRRFSIMSFGSAIYTFGTFISSVKKYFSDVKCPNLHLCVVTNPQNATLVKICTWCDLLFDKILRVRFTFYWVNLSILQSYPFLPSKMTRRLLRQEAFLTIAHFLS